MGSKLPCFFEFNATSDFFAVDWDLGGAHETQLDFAFVDAEYGYLDIRPD